MFWLWVMLIVRYSNKLFHLFKSYFTHRKKKNMQNVRFFSCFSSYFLSYFQIAKNTWSLLIYVTGLGHTSYIVEPMRLSICVLCIIIIIISCMYLFVYSLHFLHVFIRIKLYCAVELGLMPMPHHMESFPSCWEYSISLMLWVREI